MSNPPGSMNQRGDDPQCNRMPKTLMGGPVQINACTSILSHKVIIVPMLVGAGNSRFEGNASMGAKFSGPSLASRYLLERDYSTHGDLYPIMRVKRIKDDDG